jgi:mRNA interferase MazF
MKKGDIVLVPFPFTDLSGNKIRPALILIVSETFVTVCFLTTKIQMRSEFDLIVSPSGKNGLKINSLIRLNKLTTIDKDLVIGRLGTLEKEYVILLNDNLKKIFRL